MTICCRIGDRRIHRRLRHMEASTESATESGLTTRQLRIPGDRVKGASGKISRNEQGLGASKAFAYWQSRHLSYLARVSSRFPLIHSVQFSPLPLPPSCHPGQDFGLEDPRSPGRFRGPSPFPIDPTSLECAMPHLCSVLPDCQTVQHGTTCNPDHSFTMPDWLTHFPTAWPDGSWRQSGFLF